MAVNLVVPLMYLQRGEAQIVLVTFFASFALMVLITGASGFTRLLGIGHVLWIPLVLFLISRLNLPSASGPYLVWLIAVIVLNSISLVLDAVDLVRFGRGERSELVSFE